MSSAAAVTIKSYADCQRVMATARDPSAGKPLGKNTRLVLRDGGAYAVRYYQTDIVTYHEDGTVSLNHGTWQTPSTRQNIMVFSPFCLCQEKGKWFVKVGEEWIPFANGMRLDPDAHAVAA
jgi:hypothetical protein